MSWLGNAQGFPLLDLHPLYRGPGAHNILVLIDESCPFAWMRESGKTWWGIPLKEE